MLRLFIWTNKKKLDSFFKLVLEKIILLVWQEMVLYLVWELENLVLQAMEDHEKLLLLWF